MDLLDNRQPNALPAELPSPGGCGKVAQAASIQSTRKGSKQGEEEDKKKEEARSRKKNVPSVRSGRTGAMRQCWPVVCCPMGGGKRATGLGVVESSDRPARPPPPSTPLPAPAPGPLPEPLARHQQLRVARAVHTPHQHGRIWRGGCGNLLPSRPQLSSGPHTTHVRIVCAMCCVC